MNMSDCELTLFRKVISLSEGKKQDKEKMMKYICNALGYCTGLDSKVYVDLKHSLADENWDMLKTNILDTLKMMGYDKYEPYKKIQGMDLSKMFNK